ncbi:MAG: YraN family protein [Tepidisphaera sp.]|nr:YraN family protein [Tepidisphaera sp.]
MPSLLQRLGRLCRRVLAGFCAPPDRKDIELGRKGEALAAAFLKARGYAILERNAKFPAGEADLIVRTPAGEHAIVEVKTRARGRNARSDALAPELAITPRKRRTLRAIAKRLARANDWPRVGIEMIAIEWPDDGSDPIVRHHKAIPR